MPDESKEKIAAHQYFCLEVEFGAREKIREKSKLRTDIHQSVPCRPIAKSIPIIAQPSYLNHFSKIAFGETRLKTFVCLCVIFSVMAGMIWIWPNEAPNIN